MELHGKTALITGATGKIGSALALALADEGIDCICHFNSQKQKAMELADRIESLNKKVWVIEADFSRPSQIPEMFAKVQSIGPIDLLIHTAGLFMKTPLTEMAEQTEQTIIDVNLTTPIRLTRLFAKSLQKNKTSLNDDRRLAKILFFTDVAAIRPWRQYSVYCATKAGLVAVTKSLAKELAPDIMVNAIAPGIIEGMPLEPEEKIKQLNKIPIGRFGTLREIIETVLFLLKNDYVTGQVLTLDGGRIL